MMKMNLKIEYLDKQELKPYANNAKIHTDGQVKQIKKSIKEFDFNDPIAVWGENEIVEGHGRLLAAMEMDDIKTVPVIRLDHLTDKQRKAYALAHNKLTMNTDFDDEILKSELGELSDLLDMSDFGFDVDFLDEDQKDENPYSKNVKVPQYEPTGADVKLYDLCNTEKTQELIEEIDSSNIPDDVKDFLKEAAHRHSVFNYRNIAEYYANADHEVQRLMERSALVIIDIDDAIANGFVKMSESIMDMLGE